MTTNNVTYLDVADIDGNVKVFAIIDRGNGEFTSMPKEVWDELEAQREQSKTL